ncbi:MAG: OprD family outer membrane porin [Sulfurimonas sp.]|nr:OprD family outer membrane porin [Sulfurimonas sp.]
MKIFKLVMLGLSSMALGTTLCATLVSEKVTLKPNMTVEYNKVPSSVDTISEVFTEGMFYGRLRTNIFMYDYKDNSKFDHKAMGVGGSFIYKTAPISGLSATIGLYTSQNPAWFREDAQDVGLVKSGKDTFSRYDVVNDNKFGMTLFGQAYLQYEINKTTFILGRQLFESVFTKSNDTKMIPNTFDGLTATIKEILKTTIQLAYMDKQKLRDHTNSHDVIAVNDWEENDDSAINKNLTVDRIGDNNKLLIATITNKSIKNLKLNLSYALVPDVISNLTFESHYTIPINNGWKLIPGLRYMQQFDHLGASYGVANLKANQHGYTDENSLDSNFLALRLDIKKDAFLARFGYSKVADKADLVTPWRGFPTGGFTRALAQYNWYANTKSYMFRAGYDFGKANIIPGFSIMARYVIQDFDDNKDGVAADNKVIHVDMYQNISKNLVAKVRLGFVDVDDSILKSDGTNKSDTSYNEYRFELNYFF